MPFLVSEVIRFLFYIKVAVFDVGGVVIYVTPFHNIRATDNIIGELFLTRNLWPLSTQDISINRRSKYVIYLRVSLVRDHKH